MYISSAAKSTFFYYRAGPVAFQKVGIAMTCVIANVMTALTVLALIFVVAIPPTRGSFALFVSIVYIAFPVSVLSNLSTGPMFDRITPVEKKPMVMGLNMAISDLGTGIVPVLFGWISDTYGFNLALWICFGFGLLASLVNMPLVFHPMLARTKAPGAKDDVPDHPIDEDEVQRLLDNGECVPIKDQYSVNRERADRGEPFLRVPFGKYSHGNADAFTLSYDDVKFMRDGIDQRLAVLHNSPELTENYVQVLNDSFVSGTDSLDAMKRELGDWFADWLHCNGYLLGLENAQIFKGLVMESFPRIIDGTEARVDNVEEILIKMDRVLNRFLEKMEGGKQVSKLKKLKWM